MAKYVTLVKLTPKAMSDMGDPKGVYDDMIKASTQMGIKVISGYSILGPYDLMVIYEASNEILAANMSMALGAKLGGQAETWTLISPDDFTKLKVKK